MGSLEAEEALLKKKLEATDAIEERREIRKQLRELRNRKFEEEVKKITAGDYRPGRDRNVVTNGGEKSSLSSIGRARSIKDDDGEDYGLNKIENEDDLQAMLNDTPFTETDKRKKIRARLREIRNQKLGIGEPIVVKRNRDVAASVKEAETPKEVVERNNSVGVHSEKEIEEPRSSSYRRKYRNEEPEIVDNHKEEPGVFDKAAGLSKKSKYEDESTKAEERKMNGYSDSDEFEKRMPNGKEEVDVVVDEDVVKEDDDGSEEDAKEEDVIEDENVEDEVVEEVNKDVIDVEEEEINEDDVELEEDVDVREEELSNEENDCQDEDEEVVDENGADEKLGEVDEDKYAEDDYKKEEEKEERYSDEEDVIENEEDLDEGNVDDDEEEELRQYSDEELYEEEVSNDTRNSNAFKEDQRGFSKSKIEANKKSTSSYDDRSEDEELEDDEDLEQEEEDTRKDESEEEYSEDEYESDRKAGEARDVKYSEESYSDYTPTDDGSSVSGRRFEEDQNLSDFSAKSPSDSVQRRQGPAYADKIEQVFKAKEPGIQEGKDFKEKLKRTEHKPQVGGKKGAEQVDFRNLLRATSVDKPAKVIGKGNNNSSKPAQGPEQVDFRNLLQSKVKTRTLADKGLTAEQVDFRKVLKAGAVEKPKTVERKVSAAEQVDFRTVLKKEPSVGKSRTVKTDDKEIFRKIRAGGDSAANDETGVNERKTSRSRGGRPSVEALRRSGSVDKVKEDLDRQRNASTGSESDTSRKSSRLSLDALKESGDLGRTKDKSAKFQKPDEKVFKKPAAPPPKPKKKKEVATVEEDPKEELVDRNSEDEQGKLVENKEEEKMENEGAEEAVVVEAGSSNQVEADDEEPKAQPKDIAAEKETRSSRRSRRSVKESEDKKSEISDKPKEQEVVEGRTRTRRSRGERDEKTRTKRSGQNEDGSEKPRARRVVREDDATESGGKESTKKTVKAAVQKEADPVANKAVAAVAIDDKRHSLKSEEKRARLRRLRRDQNEEVEARKSATSPEPAEKTNDAEDGKNESNVISVKSSSSERVSVRVKLSGSKQPDRSKQEEQEESDDEEIGTRRNRRRMRKGSVEDQHITQVSVKTEKIKSSSHKNEANDEDSVDAKPTKTRVSLKKQNEATSSSSSSLPASSSELAMAVAAKDEEKAKEKKPTSDAAKARKAKMANLDARLAERRRQRAMDSKQKLQQTKNNRMAFKEKLDAGAPAKSDGSQSPALQRANSNMTKLLHWCQKMTHGYHNVEVQNFNKSWSDGLAFCALLHNFIPEKIPIEDLSPSTVRENFEIAFSAAAEEGVAELLEVDDMVHMDVPDTKSVITYLHAIYQTFVADRR